MEEFLQNMKTLRYQMNDVEDQAAKISVEEQMLVTTIDTLQKDVDSAKSETKRLKEDTDLMVKEKGEICSQILLKQRKLNEMELDSQSLSQTMTLILQEQSNLSAKLDEKRTYYREVDEDLTTKFQKLQDWISACKPSLKVKEGINEEAGKAAFVDGNSNVGSYLITDNLDSPEKNLMENIDAAKTKFDSLAQMKSELVSEGSKVNQSIELMKSRIREYKPELKEMDTKSLKDEIGALLSDKAGENEYLQSLQNQIEMLKGISNMVKCVCGMEYKVELDCAH